MERNVTREPGKRAAAHLWVVLAFLISCEVARAQCNPGPQEVAVFEHSAFTGKCSVYGIGNSPRIQTGNDSASSIKVGNAVQLLVCTDDYYGGKCELLASGDYPSLGSSTVGHDSISSFKVQLRGAPTDCRPGLRQVAFYRDQDYRGGCEVRGFGEYADAARIGLPNDSISSVKVGNEAQLVLCPNTGFDGDCELIKENSPNLSQNRIRTDTVSSAKVQLRGAPPPCAPGPDEITLYSHSDFSGICSILSLGNYATAEQMRIPGDSVSSIVVGTNVEAVLCRDTNFGGHCARFTETGNLDEVVKTKRIRHDSVSSARVQRRNYRACAPGPRQVALYEHSDFLAPCVVKEIGDYSSDNRVGLRRDTLSSFQVGHEVQVQLCKDARYRGDCELFTEDTNRSSMDNTRIGHDTVSSLKVQIKGTRECRRFTSDTASFFMHTDFLAPCVVKEIGAYRNAAEIGLDDNSISSLSVGGSVQVCACVAEDFGEHCQIFTRSSEWTLTGAFPGYTQNGHDIISSLKVQPRGEACEATPPARQGVSALHVTNCNTDGHPMHLWLRDRTIGGEWIHRGELQSRWSSGSGCQTGFPSVIQLTDGHTYDFAALDLRLLACPPGENHPTYGQCVKSELRSIPALATGPARTIHIY